MQFLNVFSLCLCSFLLAGKVSADAISDAADAITKEVQDITKSITIGFKEVVTAQAVAGDVMQRAIQAAIQKNSGATHGGTLVAEVAMAVQTYIASAANANVAGHSKMKDILVQYSNFIGPAIAKLMAAFRSANWTHDQIVAHTQKQAAVLKKLEGDTINECQGLVDKTKGHLDGNAAQIKQALSAVKNPAALATPLTKYATTALADFKAVMDDNMGYLKQLEDSCGLLLASVASL